MGIGRGSRSAARTAGPGDPDRQPAPVGVSTKTDTVAARAVGASPARRRRTRRRYLTVAAFLSPWIVGFLLLYAYPMLKTLYFSFTRYDGGRTPPHWVGLFY